MSTVSKDLIPDSIINSFYDRIKKLLKDADKDHPSIKKELNRILSINGNKIPEKIQTLLK